MSAPRPGDRYWLDVTYPNGDQTRFTINAQDDKAACYEAAYILGVHGPYAVPERRSPVGKLHRTIDGQFVTEGDEHHFEEMS